MNRPPWQGQRNSLPVKLTEQPRWGQIVVKASTCLPAPLISQTRPITSLG